MPRLIAALALPVVLAACERPPQPPEKDAPPEPQVVSATTPGARGTAPATQLPMQRVAHRPRAVAAAAGA